MKIWSPQASGQTLRLAMWYAHSPGPKPPKSLQLWATQSQPIVLSLNVIHNFSSMADYATNRNPSPTHGNSGSRWQGALGQLYIGHCVTRLLNNEITYSADAKFITTITFRKSFS